MKNPTGIKIVVESQGTDKDLADAVIEDAALISIRFFLQSPDGTDKVLVQALINDTNLSFEMQDQLENVLGEGNFYIEEGQLKMALARPSYKEEPEVKVLSNL
jgi:hypothetical protein